MARKGENIFKRRDGRWEARYAKKRDYNGRIIKYGYIYGKSYIDSKRRRENAIENLKLLENINIMKNKDCFSLSIFNWLNDKVSIKDSTYYNYYSIINGKLNPFFKDIKLYLIDKNLIAKFTKKLKTEELSNKRIKDILLVLNQFLNDRNISIKIDYPLLIKREVTTLNNSEISIIEKDTLNTNDIKKFAILLTLFTGIRIGELCALQWKDIDLNRKIIHVTKNLIRIKSTNEKSKTSVKVDIPKTKTSIRDIPINDKLIKYLGKYVKDDEFYVLTGSNQFMPTSKYYYFYKKYFKELNVKEYKFHAIRHSFATRSLSFGIDIKTLSVILGHTSVKLTLDLYVHITEDEKRRQINKIPLLSIK